jgi:hypothetical protein
MMRILRSSGTRPRYRQRRGIALVMTLFIVVMLLLVAAAVLSNTSYTADNALNVQMKNQIFNAAEAGVNVAQWNLDQNLAAPSGTSGTTTVQGYTAHWEIVANELTQGGTIVSDPDPQYGSLSVPAGQALLAGWASGIMGGRTVYVEEMVQHAPPTLLPKGAIVCGGTGIIDHQHITDTSGNHSADIRCGTILASGGGQIPDGNSYAVGSVNQITGYDGQAHTNATPPTFLTPGQLSTLQNRVLTQAQSGSPNFYTSGNVTGGTIGSNGADCVAYIGGSIVLNGNGSLINYCATTVVMGDVTIGGNANYQALPPGTTHIMYVFGSNGTVLHGTPTTEGIFYVANANVTIDGGGNGNFSGAIITPNNVTMNGGGTANFSYNGTQTPPPVPNNKVIPLAQWEY